MSIFELLISLVKTMVVPRAVEGRGAGRMVSEPRVAGCGKPIAPAAKFCPSCGKKA